MYRLLQPAAPLRPYVECYWIARSSAQPATLSESIFVDGKADILFNFGAAYQRRYLSAASSDELSFSNLDGQRDYPLAIAQSGHIHLVAVRFRPGGLSAFLRLPIHELSNLAVDLACLFGAEIRELEGRLYDAADQPDEQRRLLDQFLLRHLAVPVSHESARAVAAYLERGMLRVTDVSRAVGYSVRTVDRLFRQHYGISPKFYARVLRFQAALGRLAANPDGATLAQIAFDCGYYDQSHFTREFLAFAGDTPERYRMLMVARAAEPPPNLASVMGN